MSKNQVFCITGIDTDIGKTIATGLIARSFHAQNLSVITQKVVQTGCVGLSEDIIRHREIMKIDLQQADREGITCPYVFPEPCSPHLAARLMGAVIDCAAISEATQKLLTKFDTVLLEGAGGLLVPLTEKTTFLDYLEKEGYPLILVSSCRLGSINHTLSALELARYRKINVAAIIYNLHDHADSKIVEDSRAVFERYLAECNSNARVIEMKTLREYDEGCVLPDFPKLLR